MSIYQDEETYFNDYIVKTFGKELLADYDRFNKQIYLEGVEALAKNIQNLLIIETGTYPNRPDLGVGINKYLFEPLTPDTIEDLKSEINKQITRYIGYLYGNIECDIQESDINSNHKYNTLLLKILISRDNDNLNLNKTYYGFNILFGVNNVTNRLVSRIII